MSFMQPQAVKMSAWCVETTAGSETVPADMVSDAPSADELAEFVEGNVLTDIDGDPDVLLESGWYARFSAPGYLDRTDWLGPESSEDAALDTLADAFDVCRACFDHCSYSDDGCPEKEEGE